MCVHVWMMVFLILDDDEAKGVLSDEYDTKCSIRYESKSTLSNTTKKLCVRYI